ncbi:MAG TPA: hypothetical protein VFR38_03115 [Gaiellaceae bacterium]|nr:hypothetical protein [Gaiellaceae bacterium]
MCDPIETPPGTGWRGWKTSVAPHAAKTIGDWIDLTWPRSPDVPRLSSFPAPRIERIASIPHDWPVHHVLLRDGVLISEQVANTRVLAGRRAEFVFLPLNIVGGDGAPARVLARPLAA